MNANLPSRLFLLVLVALLHFSCSCLSIDVRIDGEIFSIPPLEIPGMQLIEQKTVTGVGYVFNNTEGFIVATLAVSTENFQEFIEQKRSILLRDDKPVMIKGKPMKRTAATVLDDGYLSLSVRYELRLAGAPSYVMTRYYMFLDGKVVDIVALYLEDALEAGAFSAGVARWEKAIYDKYAKQADIDSPLLEVDAFGVFILIPSPRGFTNIMFRVTDRSGLVFRKARHLLKERKVRNTICSIAVVARSGDDRYMLECFAELKGASFAPSKSQTVLLDQPDMVMAKRTIDDRVHWSALLLVNSRILSMGVTAESLDAAHDAEAKDTLLKWVDAIVYANLSPAGLRANAHPFSARANAKSDEKSAPAVVDAKRNNPNSSRGGQAATKKDAAHLNSLVVGDATILVPKPAKNAPTGISGEKPELVYLRSAQEAVYGGIRFSNDGNMSVREFIEFKSKVRDHELSNLKNAISATVLETDDDLIAIWRFYKGQDGGMDFVCAAYFLVHSKLAYIYMQKEGIRGREDAGDTYRELLAWKGAILAANEK